MIQKIKTVLLSVATLSLVAVPVMVAAPTVYAQVTSQNINQDLCSGSELDLTGGSSGQCAAASTTSFNQLLARIINVLSIIVGVIAVVMIIVGGLRYITSGGDSGKVGTAKTTIIYAIVGLVIVALAQLIVHFVLNESSKIAG